MTTHPGAGAGWRGSGDIWISKWVSRSSKGRLRGPVSAWTLVPGTSTNPCCSCSPRMGGWGLKSCLTQVLIPDSSTSIHHHPSVHSCTAYTMYQVWERKW